MIGYPDFIKNITALDDKYSKLDIDQVTSHVKVSGVSLIKPYEDCVTQGILSID